MTTSVISTCTEYFSLTDQVLDSDFLLQLAEERFEFNFFSSFSAKLYNLETVGLPYI